MSKFVLGLLLVTICNVSFAGQRIHINIEADEYGESLDLDQSVDSDWIKTDDGYILDKIISTDELPLTSCLFNSCLKMRKDGYVSFGGFIGDYDAGAEAFFFIPRTTTGDFFQALDPYHFNIEGGEYASGLWSTSADIKIVILE